MTTLIDLIQSKSVDLVVDLCLYPRQPKGRQLPIWLGWGCPCSVQNSVLREGWDGYPLLLGDRIMMLGETRCAVGFVFRSGNQAADIMRAAGKFYLWEGDFIGEATVVG